MLLADLRHDYVRTYYKPLSDCDFDAIDAIFAGMVKEGMNLLAAEGMQPAQMSFERFLDMRYVGQEFPIQTPVGASDVAARDPQRLRGLFDRLHDRRFGHQAVDEPVEIVNLRLTAIGRRQRSHLPPIRPAETAADAPATERDIVLRDPERPQRCPVYERERLIAGQVIAGPATISEYASTTLLSEDDVLTVAPSGELVIRIGAGAWRHA
jgi:N-methylhydantoinase A